MTQHIRSLDELRWRLPRGGSALCLFSGGLDSSFLLHYLSAKTACHAIALTVLIGQKVDLSGDDPHPSLCGAKHEVTNCEDEFVNDFVGPAIMAHATYLGGHPISASLSRPLMARTAVEYARRHGCAAILHTSTPSQNSLRRFNQSIADLGFEGLWGSPFEQSLLRREEKIEELRRAGITVTSNRLLSEDTNLWCHEVEFGAMDDPERSVIAAAPFVWTNTDKSAGTERLITVEFERGRPVAIDGTRMDLRDLIGELNRIAGAFGVGRYIGLEEVGAGRKVQEVREMPAAAVLLTAYRALECACVPAETIRVKQEVEQTWVREAVEGRWFGTLRKACDAFVGTVASGVCGTCRIMLRTGGGIGVDSLRAVAPLYVRDRQELEQATVSAAAFGPATALIENADKLQHRVNTSFLACDFGDRYPLPRVVAAYVLTEEQRQQIASLSRDVFVYLRDVLPRMQHDASLVEQAIIPGDFDEQQRRLFTQTDASPPSPFLARIDCVWNDTQFEICEMNVDAVGGIEDAYFLRRVYDEHLPDLRLASDLPIAGRRLAHYLRKHFPGPGLVLYTDDVCRNAGGRLAAALCFEGVEAVAVHINDFLINLDGVSWVWRHLLLTDLFDHSPGQMPEPNRSAVAHFLSLCLEGNVPVLSPVRDRLLFDKRLLVQEVARRLGADNSWEKVSKWIPATRITDSTAYRPHTVVPSGLVLKPARGFGGVGVRFPGMTLPTADEWVREPWVEQRLIDGETIPVYGGEVSRFRTVHGLHVLDGEFIGDHIRLGSGFWRVAAADISRSTDANSGHSCPAIN